MNDLMERLLDKLKKYLKEMLQDTGMWTSAQVLLDRTREIALDLAKGATPDIEKRSGRIMDMVNAAMDIVLPFLPSDLRKPLCELVKAMTRLTELQKSVTRENLHKKLPDLVEPISTAFSVPEIYISGIVALAQADWKGAADLCKLFCQLDIDKLEQMTELLPSIMEIMNVGSNAKGSPADNGMEALATSTGGKFIAARIEQINSKLATRGGDAQDLFAITDIDGNGKISQEEFNMCTVRLGYKLLPSRLNEVFSKVKKDISSQELNEQEFKAALDYLQVRVASNTLSLLGMSWPRLMMWLGFVTLILMLIILFIFLGMSAFMAGGTFSAIINSGMTVGAGLLTFKKGSVQTGSAQEEEKKTQDMVEKVQKLVTQDQ
jgi:Ca2+-binding EF-hand superfamily protein